MADSFALAATIGASVLSVSSVPSTSERFNVTINLDAGATDTSVTLAGMATPKIVIVKGAKGISVKWGTGGTDAVPANPCAVWANADGAALTAVKLSNSDSQVHSVEILAGE